MPHPSSDELLIARLFDLPAADRPTFWQRACADDPALRTRHPEFARLFLVGEIPNTATTAVCPEPARGERVESAEVPAPNLPTAASTPACPELVKGLPADARASVPDSILGATNHDAPGVRIGPMAGILASALGAADHEAPGVRIGHYKLLQKIGEGGFGAVWMAEQLEPIRRRVALKIVKVGMDTEEVIARFEVERQALALMDHPNIARVFDAGATAAGRPFFVMELVRGVAITRYCDDNRLNAEARLRLFISVCQAVQHAHQKGVIHRDLKPSNILVTVHDGTPVPKVIDFGIAKATDKQLTEKTLVTQFHAFVGTPAYTSPEQMEMSGLDVDTRSDIYSLGVLLYELLAGRPPFDPDALMKSGLEAMRRTIREIDPPRPSSRLGTLNETDRTSVAHARSTDAAKLSLLLHGDVDWIVMHCLEKDRTRRYETANALARDVQRHLANEPVAARPPSTLYRTQKLFRRHKLAVTATAAVAISLIGGLIVSSTLFVREHAARQRAVNAETSENKLRQQADAARTAEAVRASRTSLALAEQLFQEEGRAFEGLAHLVRAARADPANSGIGPRLISALAYRSFAEPIGEPLVCPAPVGVIAYAKDGRHCLTASQDARTRYWDLATGKLQIIETGEANTGDLSPNGKLVAIAGHDRNVNIWNVETGKKELGALHHERKIWRVQFSPNGRLLGTASDDLTARIWDIGTGKPPTVLQHDYGVNHITFSPDGTRVLTTTGKGPWRIWRVPEGEPVTPNIMNASWAISGAFSPDGKLFAVGFNETGAQLFDAATGIEIGKPMPHDGPCSYVAFTSDGKKLVTTSNDATARVWDVPTGKPLLELKHSGNVFRAFLTPDDRYLLTSSGDGVARVWNLASGQLAFEPVRVGNVQAVALAPDGTEFLTAGRDGHVRRWSLAPGAAAPIQFSRNPKLIGVGRESGNPAVMLVIERDRIQKVDLLTGRPLGAPRLFPTPIDRVLGFAPDGQHLAVMLASDLELWDLRGAKITRRQLGKYTGRDFSFRTLRFGFSADGTRFACVDGTNTLRAWDTNTGKLEAGPFTGPNRFAFSPDSLRLALTTGENSAVIWDFTAGRLSGDSLHHRGAIYGLAFSPDSRLLATASGGTAQLWDVKTTQPIGLPLPHRTYVRGVAFTPDGRRLLSWTPLETRVWDVATSAPLTEPMVGGNDIFGAVFSDDGTRIATFSRADRKIRLWGGVSGQLLADPLKSEGRTESEFLPTGQLKFGGTVWSLPPQSGRQPVPDWLLRLTTAFAGGEIDARAVFREQAFDAKAFDAIRRELASLPDNAPYVKWGRWILADRGTRSIAPNFTITPAEAAKFGPTREAGTEEPAPDEP